MLSGVLRSRFPPIISFRPTSYGPSSDLMHNPNRSSPTSKEHPFKTWATPLKEFLEQEAQAKDQPPHFLHVVFRVKKLKGVPAYLKKLLFDLDLYERIGKIAVHKNVPEINCKLLKVKHLIRVVPLTFPDGLPDSIGDLNHCTIRPDGSFSIFDYKMGDNYKMSAKAESEYADWLGNHEALRRNRRRVVDQNRIADEFFPAEYTYKHNQDGLEYRYSKHHLDYSKSWR